MYLRRWFNITHRLMFLTIDLLQQKTICPTQSKLKQKSIFA